MTISSFPWGGVLWMMEGNDVGSGFGRSGCLVCRVGHVIIFLQVHD